MVAVRPPGCNAVRTPRSVGQVSHIMRIDLRLGGYLWLRKRLDVLDNNIIVKINGVVSLGILSTVDMRLHRRITQRLIAFSVTDTNDWTQCT